MITLTEDLANMVKNKKRSKKTPVLSSYDTKHKQAVSRTKTAKRSKDQDTIKRARLDQITSLMQRATFDLNNGNSSRASKNLRKINSLIKNEDPNVILQVIKDSNIISNNPEVKKEVNRLQKSGLSNATLKKALITVLMSAGLAGAGVALKPKIDNLLTNRNPITPVSQEFNGAFSDEIIKTSNYDSPKEIRNRLRQHMVTQKGVGSDFEKAIRKPLASNNTFHNIINNPLIPAGQKNEFKTARNSYIQLCKQYNEKYNALCDKVINKFDAQITAKVRMNGGEGISNDDMNEINLQRMAALQVIAGKMYNRLTKEPEYIEFMKVGDSISRTLNKPENRVREIY